MAKNSQKGLCLSAFIFRKMDFQNIKEIYLPGGTEISQIKQGSTILWQKPASYWGLTFTAKGETGSVWFLNADGSVEYSRDLETWVDLSLDLVQLNAGESIYVRKMEYAPSATIGPGIGRFILSGSIEASGNIMSLVDPSDVTGPSCNYVPADYFKNLFADQPSLLTCPDMPASRVDYNSYESMYARCTGITKSPYLPHNPWIANEYLDMFNGCSSLNEIHVGATEWMLYVPWVVGVAATGTFYKPAGTEIPVGTDGIPNGWTVIDV